MKLLSTLLLAVLALAVAVIELSSANSAPNNIGFLGRGYDALKGNPKAFQFDEGFRESVYKMELSSDNKSADWRFLSPKGASISSQVTCKVSYTSRLIKSEASMQATISEDISFATDRSTSSSSSSTTEASAEASYSGFGVSASASYSYSGSKSQSSRYGSKFSKSSSYQAMQASLSSKESVYTVSEASCSVYEGSLNHYKRPEFTDEFIAAVESLPTQYSGHEATFMNFIDAFGTHVTTRVLFGAKSGVWTELSKSAVSEMESKGLSVEKAASQSAERQSSQSESHSASVSASGWGASGSASASSSKSSSSSSSSKTDTSSATDNQSESSDAFENASQQSFVYSIGSRPGDSPESWAKEASMDPLPIRYELQDITEIVHKLNPKKSAALAAALSENCPNKCSPPPQETGDWNIFTHEATHSGIRSTTAVCSNGGHLLGGGFSYASSAGKVMSKSKFAVDYRVQLNYAFPQTDGGFSVAGGLKKLGARRDLEFLGPQSMALCYTDSEMDIITVKKRGADEAPETQFKNRYASKTVSCPDDYSLVSGGYVISDNFEKNYDEVVENGPVGNSWKCGIRWSSKRKLLPSLMCFARCAKTVSEPVVCEVVKSDSFHVTKHNSHTTILTSTASCSPERMAVGGGWLMDKGSLSSDVIASFPLKATYSDRRGYLGPQSYTTEFGVDTQYAKKYKPAAVAICCDVELKSFETDLTQENSKKVEAPVKEGAKVSSPNSVSIYTKQNFQGSKNVFSFSSNDVSISNIASIYVPQEKDAYLCSSRNLRGTCTKYNNSVQDLDAGIKAQSVKIVNQNGAIIYEKAPRSTHIALYEMCSYKGVPKFVTGSMSSITQRNWHSVKVPSGYEVIFYQHPGYKGRSYRLTGSHSCFYNNMKAEIGGAPRSILFRKPPHLKQKPPSRGTIRFYTSCNYKGSSASASTSKSFIGDRVNDKVRSIKVPSGYHVVMYEHSKYRGHKMTFTKSQKCLPHAWFLAHFKFSSFKLIRLRSTKRAYFYHECGYQGSKVTHTGSDPRLNKGNDKNYSSIKVANGWKVVVWDQPNYKGNSATFYRDAKCLRDYGWDNRIRSVKVLPDI